MANDDVVCRQVASEGLPPRVIAGCELPSGIVEFPDEDAERFDHAGRTGEPDAFKVAQKSKHCRTLWTGAAVRDTVPLKEVALLSAT